MKTKTKEFYLKYLLTNKAYMVAVAGLFLLLLACISFFCTLKFTGFRLLYLMSRWNYYFTALLSIIAFFVFSAAANAGCSEAIHATLKKRYAWQIGTLKICTIVFSIYHLLLIGGLLWCSYRNDGTDYFLSILPRTYAMNILFPQIILVGGAFLASCILEKNKIAANSIMIIMLIMSSPLLEKLIWRERPTGIPIDKLVDTVRDFFSVFYQNAQWAPDIQYGLQVENVRLFIQLFWILVIISTFLWISGGMKKKNCGYHLCSIVNRGIDPVSQTSQHISSG